MAINPIVNKQVVNKGSKNRALQRSTKNSTVRNNRNVEQRINNLSNPGLDYTKNYSISIKDVDSAIFNHIKTVLRPKVSEGNELVDVPLLYGNEERWAAVRKRGVVRDKNNSLILPLIMMRRTSIEKNELSEIDYKHDIQNKYATIVRNSLWSEDNRYDRFSVQTGKKPVHKNITTGIPNYRTFVYDFVVWTAFISQMNPILELFIEEGGKYWGSGNDYKFSTRIETLSDASEMVVDNERFIKTEFNLNVKGYVLPEYVNSTIREKVSNSNIELTPSKVTFTFEADATQEQINNRRL